MNLKLFSALILFSCELSLKAQQLFTSRYTFPESSWFSSATEIEEDSSLLLTGICHSTSTLVPPQLTILKTSKTGIPLWEKGYTVNSPYYLTGVELTKKMSSDSLIFLGSQSFIDSNGFTNLIPFIGKMDYDGNIALIKGFRNSRFDNICRNIFLTSDSGFIVCGSTSIYPNIPNSPKTKIFLMKLDINLNQQWCKLYGDSENLYSGAFVLLPDGGFVISGIAAFNDTSDYSWNLIRTDSVGNIIWSKYVSNNNEFCSIKHRMILTHDSSIVVAYQTESPLLPGSDVSFAKVDLNGNLLWHRIQGDHYADDVDEIIELNDHGFMMLSTASIRRYDANGNILYEWNQNPGFISNYNSMIKTLDAGFLCVGSIINSKREMLMSKNDSTGLFSCNNISFTNLFSIASGLTLSNRYLKDSTVVFTEIFDNLSRYDSLPNFHFVCPSEIVKINTDDNIICYPNPSREQLLIKSNYLIESLDVYSSQGNLIFSTLLNSNSILLNLKSYSPGLFIVKIFTSSGIFLKKIIKIE